MYYRIPNPIPIQLWYVDSFQALDPWNGGAPADWLLSVYRMAADNDISLYTQYSAEKQQERANGQNLDKQDVLGIRSSVDGLYHILPVAMVCLWQQGRLPSTALPRLIAALEPLDRTDFYAPQFQQGWRRGLAIGLGVFGCLFFLPGLYLLFDSTPGFSGGGSLLLGIGALYLAISAVLLGRVQRHRRRIRAQEERLLMLV